MLTLAEKLPIMIYSFPFIAICLLYALRQAGKDIEQERGDSNE